MTDLFVSQDGEDIRVWKRLADGRDQCLAIMAGVGAEPAEETLAGSPRLFQSNDRS